MSVSQIFQLSSIGKPQQRIGWPKRLHRRSAIDVLCVTVLVTYFLHFALPAMGGNLADDEMMNLFGVWWPGALKSLWANVCFWTPFIRPGGALYYLPLYHFFGLNPKPYHIVQISILTASIPIVYYLSLCLSSSRLIAFLATLAQCYHPALISLVFVGSSIYDVLCGLFYFAALAYYTHIRERGDELRPGQLIGFLALYVCALDFKEMAVTLPVIILIYELLKCHRLSDRKQFVRWMCSSAAPALTAGVLTALYICGRTRGPAALIRLDAYRPHYSWSNFLKSNAHFVSELFYGFAIPKKALLGLWILVFIYAFLRRDRMLRLMAFWVVIVPLPLAFISTRGGSCLYLLLFGWAMIFAKLASDLIALLWAAIRNLQTPRPAKYLPQMFRMVMALVLASALAIFTHSENQRFGLVPAFLSIGQKTSHVIQAFRSLDLHPAPGSAILLRSKEELFRGKYDAIFIAYLVWNDHSLRIWLEGLSKPAPWQFTEVDYVISLTEFQVEIVRAREPDHS